MRQHDLGRTRGGMEAAVHLHPDVDEVLVEETPLGIGPPLTVPHLSPRMMLRRGMRTTLASSVSAISRSRFPRAGCTTSSESSTMTQGCSVISDRHLSDDLDVAGGLDLDDLGAAGRRDALRAVGRLLVDDEHLVTPGLERFHRVADGLGLVPGVDQAGDLDGHDQAFPVRRGDQELSADGARRDRCRSRRAG